MGRRGLLAGLALAATLAWGPAAGAAGPRKDADTLTIGMTSFPNNFHPNIESAAAKTYMLWMAYRPFTTFDKDWKLTCLLCTELPTIENGNAWMAPLPDGSPGIKVRFRIDPDATWGDGTPVTAKDAAFALEVGKNPQSGFSNSRLYQQDLVGIEVEDEKTFVLHRKFICDYNQINDFRLLPEHLEGPVFRANPAEYLKRNLYDTDPLNPGLWFGPYKPVRMTRGAFVVLERNPTWKGTPPAFDRIVVKTIENNTALEQTLVAGGVDMVAGEVGFNVVQGAQLERRVKDRMTVVWKPSLSYFHMDVRHDHPALKDRRVRQALMYAMDRALIVDELFYGKGLVADTHINPLNQVFHKGVYRYSYDPAKAAALLDAAGWRLRPDGWRYNAEGQQLRLELLAAASDRTLELLQQVVQDMWRRVGVATELRTVTARVMFGEFLRKRTFGGLTMFTWQSSPNDVPETVLQTPYIPTEANGWSGQNYGGYSVPEMDDLLYRMENVCRPEENAALWRRFQDLYAEDLPALPLWFRSQVFFLPPWLKGLEPTGHQYHSTQRIEYWHRG